MNRDVETELVRRAMGGDDGARMVLWSSHRRWLAAVLLARMPSGWDLEDLLQEVVHLVLLGRGHRTAIYADFSLGKVAPNRCCDLRPLHLQEGRVQYLQGVHDWSPRDS